MYFDCAHITFFMSVNISINVFDLTKLNNCLRYVGLGIYHTSVVINDSVEYYFGYSPALTRGISRTREIGVLPKVMNGYFYKTIEMGKSKYDIEKVNSIVSSFEDSDCWCSNRYNFLFHNCNTFTFELCKELLDDDDMKNYPFFVKNAEYVGVFLYKTSFSYLAGMCKGSIPFFGLSNKDDNGEKELESIEDPLLHSNE